MSSINKSESDGHHLSLFTFMQYSLSNLKVVEEQPKIVMVSLFILRFLSYEPQQSLAIFGGVSLST